MREGKHSEINYSIQTKSYPSNPKTIRR